MAPKNKKRSLLIILFLVLLLIIVIQSFLLKFSFSQTVVYNSPFSIQKMKKNPNNSSAFSSFALHYLYAVQKGAMVTAEDKNTYSGFITEIKSITAVDPTIREGRRLDIENTAGKSEFLLVGEELQNIAVFDVYGNSLTLDSLVKGDKIEIYEIVDLMEQSFSRKFTIIRQ